jgi:hypothetical protein
MNDLVKNPVVPVKSVLHCLSPREAYGVGVVK